MDSQGQEDAFKWSHVQHVIKFDYLTLKQAHKNKLNPKQVFHFKQTCDTL